MIRLRRIQPGYYEVIRTPSAARSAPAPKPLSKRQRVQEWTDRLWARYGCMVGDWAVASMTEEERERFIGGGDRRLERLADESIADGLSSAALDMGVPLDIVEAVLRKFKRTYLS